MNTNSYVPRDYDKDPIVIKDYGAYFQLSFLMLIFLVIIVLWVFDFQNGRFETIEFNSFEFFRIVIVAILLLWFIYFLYKLPKYFQAKPSFFKFSNQKFQYRATCKSHPVIIQNQHRFQNLS